MTSLEWIDFEINFCKQKINKLKSEILYQKAIAILDPKKNICLPLVNEFEISLNEERIKYLEQIKFEIEAWHSIKQGIKLCEGKFYDDSYYEYLQFEEELFDESESEDAGERLKPIKKALEVEKCVK
jgi:hypothetical protein